MDRRYAKYIGFALALWLAAALQVACQPVQRKAASDQIVPQFTQSAVVDGVGPSTASDPAQAQAEDEFLAAAIAKEQAYYDGDIEGVLSYYADDVVSVWPEMPEVVGKTAMAEGMVPYMEGNSVVGKLIVKHIWVSGDHATRQAEWEEVVTPKDGGKPEHHIGRCTLEWKKVDGKWKVISEYINYLQPPTPVES
jgi:uncharacterized protein (TIGR02246 family)